MKYPKEQWLNKSDDIKIQTIQDELQLKTHNGTTKEDLLMMLRWLFEQFDIVESSQSEQDRENDIPAGDRKKYAVKEAEKYLADHMGDGLSEPSQAWCIISNLLMCLRT